MKVRSAVTSTSGRECSRSVQAWRAWLTALATDAEAAQAAALAYRELDDDGRDAWIDSLALDAHAACVPLIAVYAPLLAVENDPVRRQRIEAALSGEDLQAGPRAPTRALIGQASREIRVAVLVSPLYMSFVQVLACGFRPGASIEWVRHDPIVSQSSAISAGDRLLGAALEDSPLKSVVDELAITIVAHARTAKVPEALKAFAHLFGPGCQ
jgi:hypothetical protein